MGKAEAGPLRTAIPAGRVLFVHTIPAGRVLFVHIWLCVRGSRVGCGLRAKRLCVCGRPGCVLGDVPTCHAESCSAVQLGVQGPSGKQQRMKCKSITQLGSRRLPFARCPSLRLKRACERVTCKQQALLLLLHGVGGRGNTASGQAQADWLQHPGVRSWHGGATAVPRPSGSESLSWPPPLTTNHPLVATVQPSAHP